MVELQIVEKADWYVFYTVSRHEKKVADLLTKNGYDVFLPVTTELKQWSDRKKKVQTPLFKSYIFVYVPASKVQTVCGFPSVSFAVKNAGKYAKIKQEEISAIRTLLSSGIYAEAIPTDIIQGDNVIINQGPLQGMEGKCVQMDAQNYFYLQVPSINHLIRIKIHSSAVRKIN